jgi:hypothetical protein
MKYAAAIFAKRLQFGCWDHYVSVCMVEASSDYEAQGKAINIAKKAWKTSDGYQSHSVKVCSENHVLDPDQDITYVPTP